MCMGEQGCISPHVEYVWMNRCALGIGKGRGFCIVTTQFPAIAAEFFKHKIPLSSPCMQNVYSGIGVNIDNRCIQMDMYMWFVMSSDMTMVMKVLIM